MHIFRQKKQNKNVIVLHHKEAVTWQQNKQND